MNHTGRSQPLFSSYEDGRGRVSRIEAHRTLDPAAHSFESESDIQWHLPTRGGGPGEGETLKRHCGGLRQVRAVQAGRNEMISAMPWSDGGRRTIRTCCGYLGHGSDTARGVLRLTCVLSMRSDSPRCERVKRAAHRQPRRCCQGTFPSSTGRIARRPLDSNMPRSRAIGDEVEFRGLIRA